MMVIQSLQLLKVNAYLLHDNTELTFGFSLTEKAVNESERSVSLDIFRTGRLLEDYQPSLLYTVSTNGSATGAYRTHIH